MATTTTNYSFNIAEGTDTVNLLTQCYPNFTSLDSILKGIDDSAITVASETKSGTVHQLVRSNANRNVIRFSATSNFVLGDTFTVDGTPVTATTPAGTALQTGDFVINSNVLAILNGAVLTVLAGASATIPDAEDIPYDNTGSGLTATDVQAAIDEVVNDIPTGFAATAITYDNSGSGLTAANVQDAIDELSSAGSPGYVRKAYGTAGQTYAQQLTALQTAFATLTVDEKMRSVLRIGDAQAYIQNLLTGRYTMSYIIGTSAVIEALTISAATASNAVGSMTGTDKSSQACADSIELYVLE